MNPCPPHCPNFVCVAAGAEDEVVAVEATVDVLEAGGTAGVLLCGGAGLLPLHEKTGGPARRQVLSSSAHAEGAPGMV